MQRWPSRLGIVPVLLFIAQSSAAQLFDSKLVDPIDAESPSGSYVLHVDPSERLGWGPANYTLARNGETVWAKELDCTLRDVVVGDNGICAGSAHRVAETGGLELVLLLLGPDGTQLFQTVLPPEQGFMHGPDYPNTESNLLMPEQDRVVFRTSHYDRNRGGHGGDSFEIWRVVDSSTGKEIAKYEPASQLSEPRGISRFASAQRIRGTPLVAVHGLVLSFDPPIDEKGAILAVLDLEGKPVWKRREAHDYEFPEDEETDRQLWPWVAKHGALIECDAPGRFEFALAQEGKRVLCEVRTNPDGQWSVIEIARSDYDLPFQEVEPTEPDDPAFALELVGTIELQGAGAVTERIWKFDIDDRGRLGAIVNSNGEHPRFVLRQQNGDLVADIALQLHVASQFGPTDEPQQPGLVWLRGDRWLVYTGERWMEDEARAHAWWLDLHGGVLTEVQEFECAPIEKADGTFDGGFVALTSRMAEYTIVETLSSFDANGHLRWEDVEAYGQSDSGLFSPEGVVVSPLGEIGVIDNIKGVIQRFDLAGKLQSEIELEQVLGREAHYPTDIGVDPQGNWVVCDFAGAPPILRISRVAQLTSSFAPVHPNGRAIHLPDGVRVAPDGSLWGSDSYALVRLDATGVVDGVVGQPPSEVDLGEVNDCFIDSTGRILMQDLRTRAVHVFDSEGKRLTICKLGVKSDRGDLAVEPDQSIWVGGSKFASNGVALGYGPLVGANLFQPASGKRWQIDDDELRLFDADGTELKLFTHSPDDRWLYTYGNIEWAVGADGTLVLSSRRSLHLFSGDGEPLRTLEDVPGRGWGNLALSKDYVFAVSSSSLWRKDLKSGALSKAPLDKVDDEGTTFTPAWREDLAELWLADPVAKRVFRFRVAD